ncbi:MAG: hypothetical protein QW282_01275 [Nitrososphaerales archaeon]
MSSSKEQFFPSTGDPIIDLLLAYGITELAVRADRDAEVTWFLGRDPFMMIKVSKADISARMRLEMKRQLESFEIVDSLSFALNVGSGLWRAPCGICRYCVGTKKCDKRGNCGKVNVPAYSVLATNIEKLNVFGWSPEPLQKKKGRDLGTLYVGLSPYWSKGNRCWDRPYQGDSTYVPIPIQSLAFYSLARYVVSFRTDADKLVQLILGPPPGLFLNHPKVIHLLSIVRRFVNTFRVTLMRIPLTILPRNVIELVILAHADLPLILEIPRVNLGLHFLVYDLARGTPKNPRGLEDLGLLNIARFYAALGPYFWDFKAIITDLSDSLRFHDFRARILQLLVRFATGIVRRNPWDINDALLDLKRLADELRGQRHIHLPSDWAIVNQAHKALELLGRP